MWSRGRPPRQSCSRRCGAPRHRDRSCTGAPAAARSAARRRSSGRTSPRPRGHRLRRRDSGRSTGLPAASRRARQFHFRDRAPSMIASEEPCVRAPTVSPGCMKEIGEHPDAALLDLCRAGVLGVIDEVSVEVRSDEALRLGLHPRRHEGGEVALRIAVEGQLAPKRAALRPGPTSRCRADAPSGASSIRNLFP